MIEYENYLQSVVAILRDRGITESNYEPGALDKLVRLSYYQFADSEITCAAFVETLARKTNDEDQETD